MIAEPKCKRFMIPYFLKERFMILTYFVSMIHDSASTPDILVKVLTGEFMRKNYASSCLLSGELKLFVIVSFLLFVYFCGAATK